jgi:hypothetical protein
MRWSRSSNVPALFIYTVWMVRLLVDRSASGEEYDARSRRHIILSTARVKRCYICTLEVPEQDIVIEDGQERCPMCKDTLTSEWLSAEEQNVAAIMSDAQLALVSPPQFSVRPLQERAGIAIQSITNSTGTVISSANRLRITGVNTTLLLNGRNFTSAMTFTYTGGVIDGSAPIITATLITLTLTATDPGLSNLGNLNVLDGVSTYAHSFISIFQLRS